MERANQEVLRHLNAILFDSRVHDKWSSEQLPMVQRIMNTVEKKDTTAPSSEKVIRTNSIVGHNGRLGSKTMHPNQRRSSYRLISMLWSNTTEYPDHSYVLFTPPVGRSDKLLSRHREPF